MTKQNIIISKAPEKIQKNFYEFFLRKSSLAIYKDEEKMIKSLTDVHNLFDKNSLPTSLKRGTDQNTPIHRSIYDSFDKDDFENSVFYSSYKELSLQILKKIKMEIKSSGKWACQRWPTIRVQFPDNISVFEFHRDSDYSHPLGEINCFYAINQCKDSSALHVEENLGHDDYKPLNLDPGEYALLNTSIFKHGDKNNITGKTRFSMDFRFIPENLLNNKDSSLSTGRNFSVDSYFMSEDYLTNN